MKMYKIALTIAGSDPAGGAGLQADLRTFQRMGVYGLSIPSVLTAQNTEGVSNILELPNDFFSDQTGSLLKDIRPDALKTGMLYSPDIVEIIAGKIREGSLENLVVDPILASSTGVELVKEGLPEAVKKYLFPLSKVITPNINEASVLTGIAIQGETEMKDAAVKLRDYGAETVIVTGGHLQGKAVDLLFDGEEFLTLENERLEGEFHGTGCAFSATVTACLALGYSVKEAFVKANDFTRNAMKTAFSAGRGMKILNI